MFKLIEDTEILIWQSYVQIPIGARFIAIPGTQTAESMSGSMVEVYWQQDDSGSLCIAGNSEPIPVPPNIQVGATTTITSGNILRRRRQIRGFVIDSSQITPDSQ